MFKKSEQFSKQVLILDGLRSDLSALERKLLDAALAAQKHAYAPYSKFRVGASVLAGKNKTWAGRIFSGCNVENATYSPTSCAEVSAIDAAVSQGYRHLRTVLVVTENRIPQAPCGRCRQKIVEFGRDVEVIMASSRNKRILKAKISELLPHPFKI